MAREYKCGDLGMHFYQNGDSCMCGQIPEDIFFSVACTCGVIKFGHRKTVHSPDCAYIKWAEKRNQWIKDNPTTPKLKTVTVNCSEYYNDWNNG